MRSPTSNLCMWRIMAAWWSGSCFQYTFPLRRLAWPSDVGPRSRATNSLSMSSASFSEHLLFLEFNPTQIPAPPAEPASHVLGV